MWGDSFQRSSSIHHVNFLDSLEGKEQEKLIQRGRRLGKGGVDETLAAVQVQGLKWRVQLFKRRLGPGVEAEQKTDI